MPIPKNLPRGAYVRFVGYPELTYGTIVEHRPQNGGYLVRPEGEVRGYGFGYGELEHLPDGPPKTFWQRLNEPGDDDDFDDWGHIGNST